MTKVEKNRFNAVWGLKSKETPKEVKKVVDDEDPCDDCTNWIGKLKSLTK